MCCVPVNKIIDDDNDANKGGRHGAMPMNCYQRRREWKESGMDVKTNLKNAQDIMRVTSQHSPMAETIEKG